MGIGYKNVRREKAKAAAEDPAAVAGLGGRMAMTALGGREHMGYREGDANGLAHLTPWARERVQDGFKMRAGAAGYRAARRRAGGR